MYISKGEGDDKKRPGPLMFFFIHVLVVIFIDNHGICRPSSGLFACDCGGTWCIGGACDVDHPQAIQVGTVTSCPNNVVASTIERRMLHDNAKQAKIRM